MPLPEFDQLTGDLVDRQQLRDDLHRESIDRAYVIAELRKRIRQLERERQGFLTAGKAVQREIFELRKRRDRLQ